MRRLYVTLMERQHSALIPSVETSELKNNHDKDGSRARSYRWDEILACGH